MIYSDSNTKVMVIEDDPFMQSVLAKYLGKHFEVIVFPDGLDAMAAIHAGNIPDVIIADLKTPLMGGLQVLEQLKASDFFNSIPVIVLTADESSAKRMECLEKGAEDFMSKPFNPQELKLRLSLVLKRNAKLIIAA
jgi:DNA-binding response OmpR family regulator